MSRHRDVRSLNYSDECDGYDDVYGHSVEDDYSISPSVEQFMFDRSRQSEMSAFIKDKDGIAEEDEDAEEGHEQSLSPQTRPRLNELDEARLQSCLDEIRNVIGESTPERLLIDTIVKNGFDLHRSLDAVLNSTAGKASKTAAAEPREKDLKIKQTLFCSMLMLGSVLDWQVLPSKPDLGIDAVPLMTSTPEPVKVAKAKTLNITKGFEVTPKSGQKDGSLRVEPMETSPRSQSPLSDVAAEKEAALAKHRELRGEAAVARYNEERSGIKPLLHMVVIGHVDAGKSTLMGHLLYDLGQVNQRTMHKYEQESKKLGKQSFMYAWILDETGEERTRGITMDIGQSRFETPTKSVLILDAPGHKDFIPNMISGATQADAAVLVVDAGRGEFESGFESGGQTREHALLVRSLGVSQLVVVVNKLDTVSWDQTRFLEIANKLGAFLRQAGYRDTDVSFVPCSGLSGENLTKSPTEDALLKWYHGPCLVEAIDKFKIPERPISKSFRLSINDIFKGTGTGFCVSGRVECGSIQVGDKVLVQPQGEQAFVKGLTLEEMPCQVAFAGDQVTVTLSGIDMQNVCLGYILCDPLHPIPATSRIEARIVLFNLQFPITQGFPVFFHSQSLVEQAVVTKLISQLNRGSGEVIKRHPRCLPKNTSAVVEITLNRPVGLELYRDVKELGRFMLRSSGVTIAAGLVNKV
ncbi:protein HBS1 isoform X2 [Neocloeon triangulifer]|uniref:protein HBS1 isoform X2 n=1 Tax=Neocloeon triangulifer TaxID=2078957 RepID=UPI00286FA392|nr:protein HBS1 isoform X2 [Neocloeon triangulifer]